MKKTFCDGERERGAWLACDRCRKKQIINTNNPFPSSSSSSNYSNSTDRDALDADVL